MRMADYDHQNIFAKILRGEIPCFKVYETSRTLAFLDILDIAEDDLAEVARSAKRVAIAAMKAFAADGIIIQQFSEPASGQVVLHLHIHVMPVTEDRELLPPQTVRADMNVLEDHARRMIAAIGG